MFKNLRCCVRVLVLAICLLVTGTANAQRTTDLLDRGLVAMRTGNNVFVSWRIQPDEYYDVKYNLYRNGTIVARDLTSSNYLHTGVTDGTYEVRPVLNGAETKALRTEQVRHGGNYATATTWATNYFEIPMANVQASNGVTIWKYGSGATLDRGDYTINDVSVGDVDGDGKMDFIVKRINQWDANNLFPTDNGLYYAHIECYASSINYGRLWWIDCGPNICYGADKQWDALAYDWNQDGVAEVIYRGGANTVLHHSDGTTQTIGKAGENIRGGISHVANMTFTNAGEEWLMYLDGRTGKAYDVIEYPLARGAASDWGDGYGHRSSKYFVGAPFLDGKNPYIFLGRGIYTKIMACTYGVNKSTNKLYKIGNTWQSYTNKGWYGQGYHNFAIADVDEDGSDEVVYGSMVLDFHTSDRSLHGMSSSSLGHGDASHTGDLDPYRKGLETFACNEDDPAMNYRNAATCEIYARMTSTGDDGRSMAGNFTNEYPGGIGASTASGIVPLSYIQPNPYSPTYISGMTNNWNGQTPYPMALNFRIYWDGDLLDESINGPGSNESYLYVDKLGARIFDTNSPQWSTACINGTKKNPCATGDIFGDWREEIVMRTSDNMNLRIYTTNKPTEHRMQSLWYDHQYRQAMVWQSEGYNQPPHTSYFVGELEDLTQAPPALTNEGRVTPYNNNGSLELRGSLVNGKEVLICPGEGEEVTVNVTTESASFSPRTIFLVANTTIEGGDQVKYNETKHKFSRIRLAGNPLAKGTNICKQGDAAAHLPYATFTHTGKTDVWAGALIAYGSITNSPMWANRHTELFLGNADAANVSTYKSLKMEYGSRLFICDHSKNTPLTTDNGYGKMTVGDLFLKEGAAVEFDVKGAENADGDKLNIGKLTVVKRNWAYGPRYSAPVFRFNTLVALTDGQYEIGTLNELGTTDLGTGELTDIVVEVNAANSSSKKAIVWNQTSKKLYLYIGNSVPDFHEDITPHPANATVVGPENNKVGFHSQFSPYYTVEDGQTVHLEYINYNDDGKGNKYDNGVFILYGAKDTNAQGEMDMTSYITNAACSGTSGTAGAPGWTCTGNGNMPYLFGDYFENWVATASSANFDYYQNISVPNGKYVLSADVFLEGAQNDNENGIYASSNGVEVRGGSYAGQQRGDDPDDPSKKNAPVFKITTTPIIEVTNGTLRVGFKNFTTQTGNWSAARNFTLTKLADETAAKDVTSTYVVNAECTSNGGLTSEGWTIPGNTFGNKPSKTLFENWAAAANKNSINFDYYQELTVPNGKYYLKADAFTNGATQANEAGIYVSSGGVEVKAGTRAGMTEASKGVPGYETIQTDVIEVTNGKLRIGFKAFDVAERTSGWNVAKNFKLMSYVTEEEELFALSADEHSWGPGWDKRATTGTMPAGYSRDYQSNWGDANIAQYMNGAKVAVDVTFKDGVATYESTVTSLDGSKTRTDKFVANNIDGNSVRFRFTVENSHIAIDNDSYSVTGGIQTVGVLNQDFEGDDWADGWYTSNNGRVIPEQVTSANGTKAILLRSDLALTNNGAWASYTFPDFEGNTAAVEYELNFDFAQTSISNSTSDRFGTVDLKDINGNILCTFRAGNFATTGEILVDGQVQGTYPVTQGVRSTTYIEPKTFVHVKVVSDKNGTTVKVGENTPVTVSNSYTTVKEIIYNSNRYAGQIMFDNFTVDCKMKNSFTVKTNVNGFATFGNLDYNIDFNTVSREDEASGNSVANPTEFRAYIAGSVDETTLYYNRTYMMYKGEGVLIIGNPSTVYKFYQADDNRATTDRTNFLHAGDNQLHPGCYALSTKNGVSAFRPLAATAKPATGKAYMELPPEMQAKGVEAVMIEIDDDATGVGAVITDEESADESDNLYTIGGRKATKSYRGVVVGNDRKSVRK